MGLCFSKKKPPAKPGKIAVAVSDDKAKKPAPQQRQQPKRAAGKEATSAAANKAAVFVVRPGSSSAKDAAAAAPPPGEDPKKKRSGSSQEPAAPKQLPVVLVPSAPVRTSSCTKEEVDAILIQCGRLSRSSSGAGTGRAASSSGETGGGGHRRRRSGSKRSYDFDQEAARAGGAGDEECDWERHGAAAAVSRPSPHRGSPQRKRSGSRERSSGGGGSGSRRASRSPGRRADGAAASAATAGSGGGGDRARQQQQQPGKMVSVPAREKGRAPSPAKRCASPRSSSPARMAASGNENAGGGGPAAGPTPVLSRSSSRKNEQSPYRRNPMAELDENSLRNNSNHSARPHKKSTETAVAATPKKATGRGKEPTAAVPSSCSGKEKPEIAEDAAAVAVAASETRALSSKTNATRTVTTGAQPGCRSRRASRDFDQNPGSYTTHLLEDIHNYHQQSSTSATPPATPSFTLPACVAKACSIVDAVADLNSSSSENNRTYECQSADDKGSVNAPAGSDDFVEPSAAAARKHLVPPVRERERDVVRAETEGPQESAGSNSVSGHPWTPSWEPTSVESSDRTWSTGDEVVEQSGGRCSPMNRPRQTQSKQRQSQHEPSGGRSRAGSGNGNGNGLHRGRSAHRGSGSVASGRSGVRVVVSANS